MRKTSILLISLCLPILMACPQAQVFEAPWPEPYRGDSALGGALERALTVGFAPCGIRLDSTRNTTLVDPVIAEQLGDIDRPVAFFEESGAANLFRFVFSGRDLAEFRRRGGEQRRYMERDVVAFRPLPLPMDETTARFALHTCGTLVAAAARFGVRVPAVSIEAAVESERSGRGIVRWIAGRLRSPFGAAMYRPLERDAQLATHMSAWLWYVSNPADTIPGAAWYLDSFDGVALIALSGGSRLATAELSGEAAIRFVAALSAEGRVTTESANALEYRGHHVIIYLADDSSTHHFERMPTVQEIQDLVRRRAMVTVTDRPSLTPLQARSLVFTVAGIPAVACRDDLWNIEAGQGDHMTLGRDSARVADLGGRPGCRFWLRVRATSESADEVTATLNLVFTETVGTQRLVIPFTTTFNSSRAPVLGPITAHRARPDVRVLEDGTTALSWTLRAPFEDPEFVNWDRRPEVREGWVRCGTSPRIPISLMRESTARLDNGGLSLLPTYRSGVIVDASTQFAACSLEARVAIPVRDTMVFRWIRAEDVDVPRGAVPSSEAGVVAMVLRATDPVAMRLTVPTEVSGELRAGLPQLPDGSFVVPYDVELEAGDSVEIDLRSDSIDALLILIGPGGFTLSDDDSGGDLDAKVSFRAPTTGRYRLLAASYDSDETGPFTLRIARVRRP
ncbi:MAG: hypothetical protein WD934_02505 [Gemmatimonadales bacterium]